jgi:hypothetical protein
VSFGDESRCSRRATDLSGGMSPMSRVTAFVLALTASLASARGQEARVGEEKERYIDVVNKSVNWNGRDSGTETYDAPAGWYIVGYRADEKCQFGRGGWSISHVEAGSDFVTEQKINELFEEMRKYAREQNQDKYAEQLESLRKHYLDSYARVRSSHSKVVIKWEVRGGGNVLKPTGGRLELGLRMTQVRFLAPDIVDPENWTAG